MFPIVAFNGYNGFYVIIYRSLDNKILLEIINLIILNSKF